MARVLMMQVLFMAFTMAAFGHSATGKLDFKSNSTLAISNGQGFIARRPTDPRDLGQPLNEEPWPS